MARVKKSRSPGVMRCGRRMMPELSFVGIFLTGISRLPIRRITMSDLENLDVQGLILTLDGQHLIEAFGCCLLESWGHMTIKVKGC